jgi:transcriptional regulator with XRE-family HTH domain
MRNKKSADPVDKHVGAKVRMRRIMLGMSQTNLADGLGVTFQQVQKYERGTNRISASRLQQITNVLKVQTSFFFDGAPALTAKAIDAKASNDITDFLANKEGLALAKAFMAIEDNAVRKRVVELVIQVARP